MEYLHIHLQKYIIDYLSPNENFLLKFVNKNFYNIYILFNIETKYPTEKELYNTKILKWFIYNIFVIPNNLQKTIMKILISKFENKDFIYCLTKDFEYCEEIILFALKYENNEILNILMNNRCTFNYQTIIYASEKGNFKILKWLFKHIDLCHEKIEETDYLRELLPLAILSKNIDCVKFLMKKNCIVTYCVLLLTIAYSSLDIFIYILENISNDLSVFFWPHKLLEASINVSKLNFANYIYDKFSPQLNENLYDILFTNYIKNFKKENTSECIRWLLKKNCFYNSNQKEFLKYNLFIDN